MSQSPSGDVTPLQELQEIAMRLRKLCTDDFLVWAMVAKTSYPHGTWDECIRGFTEYLRLLP